MTARAALLCAGLRSGWSADTLAPIMHTGARCMALALAAAVALAPTTAHPVGSPGTPVLADQLAEASAAYHQATVAKDTRRLAALVTDDYMLVNSDASVQGKLSYLADFAVPGFRIDPYVVERPFSKIYSDTALTGGTMQLRWTQAGQRHSRKLRAAHFWVRLDGRWRLAYSQLTRIPA